MSCLEETKISSTKQTDKPRLHMIQPHPSFDPIGTTVAVIVVAAIVVAIVVPVAVIRNIVTALLFLCFLSTFCSATSANPIILQIPMVK